MLKNKLQQDLVKSQKEKETLKLSVLRMLLSELHNEEIKQKKELSDEQIAQILSREKKRRRESYEQFKNNNRDDLAEKEKAEQEIIVSYLPDQLSEGELKQIVGEVAEELVATEKDFGRVMKEVMGRTAGRADGSMVSKMVKEQLNKK